MLPRIIKMAENKKTENLPVYNLRFVITRLAPTVWSLFKAKISFLKFGRNKIFTELQVNIICQLEQLWRKSFLQKFNVTVDLNF